MVETDFILELAGIAFVSGACFGMAVMICIFGEDLKKILVFDWETCAEPYQEGE